MNRIEGINSYSRLGAVNGPSASSPEGGGKQTRAYGKNNDQVEISSAARYLSKIAAMPEIRAEKVETIRQALLDGSYDLEGKLPEAVERLLDDYLRD